MQNLNLTHEDTPTCLKVSFDDKQFGGISFALSNINDKLEDNASISLSFTNCSYEICLSLRDSEYKILSEKAEFKFDVCKIIGGDSEVISQNSLYLKNIGGNYEASIEKENELFDVDDLVPSSSINIAKNSFEMHNVPLINSPLSSVPFPWVYIFRDIKCFNFNPQFAKGVSEINGDNTLHQYGENLAVILNKIFRDNDKKRKFLNLLNDLLPYVKNIEVNQFNDNQMFFTITEQNNVEIPSFFISDGTINVISLIVSLYFDDSKYIFIEEPERNIHPSLLSKVVEMVEEASVYKQIILTTHSPEILKYMDLNNVLFISKGNGEFSLISKPIDNETLMPFIEELGIDEIFVDNYLELGNG